MTAPAPTADVTIRPATRSDVPLMVDYRSRMYRELGWEDEARLEFIRPLAEQYLRSEFATGGCSGFVAESEGKVVASVAIVWQRMPPTPRNSVGVQGYVLGMYVLPEFRRRGIARNLMTACIECATESGAPAVLLHASDVGQVLYEKMGFALTTEMRLFTQHAGDSAWRTL